MLGTKGSDLENITWLNDLLYEAHSSDNFRDMWQLEAQQNVAEAQPLWKYCIQMSRQGQNAKFLCCRGPAKWAIQGRFSSLEDETTNEWI